MDPLKPKCSEKLGPVKTEDLWKKSFMKTLKAEMPRIADSRFRATAHYC